MTASVEETNKFTWEEFENTVDHMVADVSAFMENRGEEIHVISQLHRTGGIVGSMMAVKMHIVPLLPVQFKYSYQPEKIHQIISVPDLLVDVPEDMNILLCEGNTSSGSIAMRSAKVIHKKYPKAKIYLATVVKVFGCPDKLEGIEHVFYGVMSNERGKATPEEASSLQ